jgi:hypothetical protein
MALLRDDTTGVGWAVEHTVMGAAGHPLDWYAAAVWLAAVRHAEPVCGRSTPLRWSLE